MTDTSTAKNRKDFCDRIMAGAPLGALATLVENNTSAMPEEVCATLDVPMRSTFARGAIQLQNRATGHYATY